MNPELASALVYLAPIWLVAAVTPGPNFFAVMHVAGSRGRGAAVMAVLGTVTGTAIWAIAGFLGLKALFVALPFAATAIKMVGAAYLVWVGIGFWRQAGRPLRAADLDIGVRGRSYRLGVVTNLANPKTAAFAASLFAVALPPAAPASWVVAAIATVCAISASWYLVLATVGSSAPFTRAYQRWRRALQRFAGVLFAAFGLKLALEPVAEQYQRAEAP